jgi:hypothetical protein
MNSFFGEVKGFLNPFLTMPLLCLRSVNKLGCTHFQSNKRNGKPYTLSIFPKIWGM